MGFRSRRLGASILASTVALALPSCSSAPAGGPPRDVDEPMDAAAAVAVSPSFDAATTPDALPPNDAAPADARSTLDAEAPFDGPSPLDARPTLDASADQASEASEPPLDACIPDCAGRACGSDGCGGGCGDCASGETCTPAGQCVCTPSCGGRACGPDGCGGECGSCGGSAVCDASGQCVCTPGTCGSLGYQCGMHSDGCGKWVDCGGCAAGDKPYCAGDGKCHGTEICGTLPLVGACQQDQSGRVARCVDYYENYISGPPTSLIQGCTNASGTWIASCPHVGSSGGCRTTQYLGVGSECSSWVDWSYSSSPPTCAAGWSFVPP